jgi:hypothetical protein
MQIGIDERHRTRTRRRGGLAAALALLAVLAVSVGASGGGTVRGKLVRAGANGAPAARVRVTIAQGQQRSAPAYSASDGMFSLPNVPAGAYRLEVWTDPKAPLTYAITVSSAPYTDIAPITVP